MQFRISTVSLLLVLFGTVCFAQNKTAMPPEKFSVITAKLANGKPAVGSYNTSYNDYTQKAKSPWCLTINMALELKNMNDQDLPNKAESDIANDYQDYLLAKIKPLATVHYVGHVFNDSFLDIYIYLDDPEKVHAFLQTETNRKGVVRPFSYRIQKDPTWKSVDLFFNAK